MERRGLTARQAGRRDLTVIKLGGSLANSNDFSQWLDALARCAGCAVVVPGGGPFADQVRDLQRRLRFDDATAHHLAILAMEQFGRILAALEETLVPAASHDQIKQALRANRVPVWMPAAMTLGRSEIPETWEVTSDSLAAWLACELHAARLLLVKSAEPPPGPVGVDELARQGLVDPAFPRFLAACGVEAWCLGPGHPERLASCDRSGSRITA